MGLYYQVKNWAKNIEQYANANVKALFMHRHNHVIITFEYHFHFTHSKLIIQLFTLIMIHDSL